ncbi:MULTISPECIES: class I SAM-dependent methyltransferase [Streptomyces]|uniref:Class I SAM-dependent methyltransferase n=1 Tax=Streptomyces halobius TaxID=2879846 RepID=A0ABY4MH79_9ACTN|nr:MULTISPECIES: class I SAM-dependent methyltransferase [Streptomyces]AWN30115.1 SAM-dependent methyltransferase [Streptomyces sp. NEAU-S7GS2]MCL7494762.1 class I SAM-dependent methyltransferase [Streptomyces sp. MCA2]UQA96617.1 class I SAM-dependent methyltransferase [Streptomyces halobius]
MNAQLRTDAYSTGPFSMDELTERDRLLLLEQTKDPATIHALESLPLLETWRCLEIGAGAGSIAHWLGERCPQGHVIAADIDTRNLDPHRSPNVEGQEVDISTHTFAPSSFDLIHARAVLCHLPARDEILARALEWLAPGGWLLVEDVYTLPVGSSPYTAMNHYAAAARHAAQARGADMQWGSKIPGILATLGFGNVTAESQLRLVGTGGALDDLWRINLQQAGRHLVRDGHLAQNDLDACLALLDDPNFTDIRYIGITARGQKLPA